MSFHSQVDILTSDTEVDEVVEFVRANATRLLGVEAPRVLPVSSRTAMEAKVAAAGGEGEWGQGPICLSNLCDIVVVILTNERAVKIK